LYLPGRNNNNTWRKEFYYEFPGQGSSRIIPAANAVVRKDFKLFRYPEHNLTQLFNLQEDPLEEFDLANDPKYAHVVEELQRRYTELMASVV
jgi:arylsulfatase A-like enzyme